MAEPARLLILGGTNEAQELAQRTADDPRLRVTTSLAGRTRSPALLPGHLRQGGFGGAEGLADYIVAEHVDLLIDATHPFAAVISEHAAIACHATGIPNLLLNRPAWQQEPGDCWLPVPDMAAAAAALEELGRRVFLTVGRQELGAFARLTDHWFLVRLIDPPEEPLPLANHEIVLGRGPFDEVAEHNLLTEHRIEALVSKNSGGPITYTKVAVARALALPVVMIERPTAPPGEAAPTVDAAMSWIDRQLG